MERKRRTATDTSWRPRKFIKVYDGFSEAFGTAKGLILSVLINRYDNSKQYDKLQNGAFYLVRSEIQRLTGYDKMTIIKYLNEMRGEMLIVTDMRGTPPKQWFSINFGVVHDGLNRIKTNTNGNRIKTNTIENSDEITEYPHVMEGSQENLNRIKNNTNNNRTRKKYNYSSEEEHDNRYSSDHKIVPDQFDSFWNLYPKQIAYGKAKTVWDELCTQDNRPTWRQIKLSVFAQTNSPQWQKQNFIPLPTTWLREKRWRDNADDMKGYATVKALDKELTKIVGGEEWLLKGDGYYYNDEGRRLIE